MTSEQIFLLVIVMIVLIMIAIIQLSNTGQWIKRAISDRFNINHEAGQHKPPGQQQPVTGSSPRVLTAKESKAELERLLKLIEDRKQVARDTDIAHHLWGLYQSLLRYTRPHSLDRTIQDGEWYDVKILQVSSQNGLSTCEFELKGARYRFVDDEEKQGWCENTKSFSLFLYDDADRCLIETPMRMNVDSAGRRYTVLSSGPNAFLPGDWIKDFINVKLKHQRMRNQEIRAQKHQERLCEIQELRDRFGILD